MKTLVTAAAAVATLLASTAHAVEGPTPHSEFGKLDHVFVIMMENQAKPDVLGSPYAPFINAYVKEANQATNYWAVGHPSLTNYLEIVGGSNFGVTDDFYLNWPVIGCVDNLPKSTSCAGALNPISGPGTDVAIPLTVDPTTNTQIGPLPAGTVAVPNNWSIVAYPSITYTPKTIAHQLVEKGGSWKTYQQSLPTIGNRVNGVNYSDGYWSNLSLTSEAFTSTKGATVSVQKLYAVKHNPFVYFDDVIEGLEPALSMGRVSDFSGAHGLFADLASGHVPNFAFIAPNQCADMHAAGGGSAQCGTGGSPTVIQQGDAALKTLIDAIHASPAWKNDDSRSAIVVVWDENDYGNSPNTVILTVETNYGHKGVTSRKQYNHFSLTKTIEAAFGLHCLNHACDESTKVMDDLFR